MAVLELLSPEHSLLDELMSKALSAKVGFDIQTLHFTSIGIAVILQLRECHATHTLLAKLSQRKAVMGQNETL